MNTRKAMAGQAQPSARQPPASRHAAARHGNNDAAASQPDSRSDGHVAAVRRIDLSADKGFWDDRLRAQLVVANILLALGMFMLSPTIISLPFKILLFVLVDGWSLVIGNIVRSFAV